MITGRVPEQDRRFVQTAADTSFRTSGGKQGYTFKVC